MTTQCPGCRFLRTWNTLYRAVWEAGDRCADLSEQLAALGELAEDPRALAQGVAQLEDALVEAREHLNAIKRAVACTTEAQAGRN